MGEREDLWKCTCNDTFCRCSVIAQLLYYHQYESRCRFTKRMTYHQAECICSDDDLLLLNGLLSISSSKKVSGRMVSDLILYDSWKLWVVVIVVIVWVHLWPLEPGTPATCYRSKENQTSIIIAAKKFGRNVFRQPTKAKREKMLTRVCHYFTYESIKMSIKTTPVILISLKYPPSWYL